MVVGSNPVAVISGLVTYSALTAVVTKISEIKKKVTDHDHDKNITTSEFNKLTTENFAARLTQANLLTKTDFDNKLISLDRKIHSNKTKHVLVENELKKLQTFDSSYFLGKSHFEDDGAQNYLVFQPINRYSKRIIGVGDGEYIYFLKSKGLSDERINSITVSNYSITPSLDYRGAKIRVKFNGSCLKQSKITYSRGKIVNI